MQMGPTKLLAVRLVNMSQFSQQLKSDDDTPIRLLSDYMR